MSSDVCSFSFLFLFLLLFQLIIFIGEVREIHVEISKLNDHIIWIETQIQRLEIESQTRDCSAELVDVKNLHRKLLNARVSAMATLTQKQILIEFTDFSP